jgi:DNA-directed RNA polymerase subunit H (RpoH/RPB5)
MKTTQEAFAELLNSPQAAEKMGIKQEQIYVLRNRLSKGKVSIQKMENHLAQAGYGVAHEKMWLNAEDFEKRNKILAELKIKYDNVPTSNKNKPSFAPGGTLTNSSGKVEIPKDSLTKYMSCERVIIKIDKTKDSETTNKVLAALNIEPEKLGEVYKSVPKEYLKEKK